MTSILLRFISCGLLCLLFGFLWWLHSPQHNVGVASALADMLILLFGFILGGLGWYIHDVRLRKRHPERIDETRIVFSFIVFALIPLAVLAVVFVVWVLALFIGG